MVAGGGGQVIFISSIAGRLVMPYWGTYNMTKFALSAAADVLRQEQAELGVGVQVSVVEPGTYHTGFNQRVMATKYEWLDKQSAFYPMLERIKKREEQMFSWLERQSTASIVAKIVQAVQASRPHLRYSAPWWQYLFVQLLRIFGK